MGHAKHTPGPWVVLETTKTLTNIQTNENSVVPDCYIKASNGLPVAHVSGINTVQNSRVLAAAAELLEALERMNTVYMILLKKSGSVDDSIAHTARMAILKATGGAE